MIFLDTSAIYALADNRDPNHATAIERLQAILDSGEEMITHSYVLVESISLIQARLGTSAATRFAKESANFSVVWVDQDLHATGVRQMEKAAKRRVSFVDHISFLVMNRRGVMSAFAYDSDFVSEGFRLFAP